MLPEMANQGRGRVVLITRSHTDYGRRSLKAHKPIRAINATLFDQNVHNELPHAVNGSGPEALNQVSPSHVGQGRHFIASGSCR